MKNFLGSISEIILGVDLDIPLNLAFLLINSLNLHKNINGNKYSILNSHLQMCQFKMGLRGHSQGITPATEQDAEW